MGTRQPAQALNALLMELEDGRKGYALAAEEFAPELRPLLVECAHDCTRAMHDLQKSVHAMGEPIAKHGSAAGAMRQGWARLKQTVGSGGKADALRRLEREYARLESAFKTALAADLAPQERSLVVRERARVRNIPLRLTQARRLDGAA